MPVSLMLFSAYQGWGRAIVPLLASLPRIAIVLPGGWIFLQQSVSRFGWLYDLVAGSTVIRALTLGTVFLSLPAAKSTQYRAFRLKSGPALITQGLRLRHFFFWSYDQRASGQDGRCSRIFEQQIVGAAQAPIFR